MHGPDNEDLKLVSCPRCEYETTNTQCLKRHIDAQHEGQNVSPATFVVSNRTIQIM